jgi:hypothetical protein
VLFYDYDENAEKDGAMLQYFQKKVASYRQQDKKAKKKIREENYVNTAWLLGCLGKSCSECSEPLTYERGRSNLTAQRIDNALGHELDNLVPMCISCNCALSNR